MSHKHKPAISKIIVKPNNMVDGKHIDVRVIMDVEKETVDMVLKLHEPHDFEQFDMLREAASDYANAVHVARALFILPPHGLPGAHEESDSPKQEQASPHHATNGSGSKAATKTRTLVVSESEKTPTSVKEKNTLVSVNPGRVFVPWEAVKNLSESIQSVKAVERTLLETILATLPYNERLQQGPSVNVQKLMENSGSKDAAAFGAAVATLEWLGKVKVDRQPKRPWAVSLLEPNFTDEDVNYIMARGQTST